MSHVWKSPTGQHYVLAAKGAPEAIADLCHLDEDRSRQIADHVAVMAQEGLRVLGVAIGVYRQQRLPGEQHDFTFAFLGLVGLADPVRPRHEIQAFAPAQCDPKTHRVPSVLRVVVRQLVATGNANRSPVYCHSALLPFLTNRTQIRLGWNMN